jgi:hypothetical protein
MPNHTGRLVLAPQDPSQAPDRSAVAQALADAGFLGPALRPDANSYAVGESFLQLVSFAGCAVHMEIAPHAGADRPFCHARIAGPYPAPRLLTGSNTRPPRCPTCRAPHRNWRSATQSSLGAEDPLPCPACGAVAALCAWDWKESGGCARLTLSVEEVFPGEAAPTDTLLQILAKSSGMPWRHFYLQD